MRAATILMAAVLSLSGCIAHRLSVAPSDCATPQSCARLLYEHAREVNSARLTEGEQQVVIDRLRSFGSDGVDELSNLLGWWQPTAVQEVAACALARLGPEATQAIPALVHALDEKLGCSAEALGSTRDPIAIEHLRALLAGGRCSGAVGLGFAGPAGAEVLATYLENASDSPCLEAVSDALRELGEDAAPVAERLRQLARDEEADDAVREVAKALANDAADTQAGLDPSALVAQLKSPDRRNRSDALRRLARLGPSAASALPDLVDVLESGSVDERVLAAFALGWIGDEDAVPALAKAVSRDYWEVSLEAVRALAHCRTPEAAEALRTASTHWFWLVRDAAADASREGGPQPYSVEAVEASDRAREALLVSSLCSAPPTEVLRGGKKLALEAARAGTSKASDDWFTRLEGRGSISLDDEARSEMLRSGAALGSVQVRGKLYAITGSPRADVFALERDGARWTLRHVVQLPGYPTGWAVDAAGALVLGTTRGVAALMPDGTLTSDPCPPPASLK